MKSSVSPRVLGITFWISARRTVRKLFSSGFLAGASWILSTCFALPVANFSWGGPLAAALASAAFLDAGTCFFVLAAPCLRFSITLRKRGSASGAGLGSGRLRAVARGIGYLAKAAAAGRKGQ